MSTTNPMNNDAIAVLESALADYKSAVAEAQSALGEFAATSPTLPAACRRIHAALMSRHTDLCMMNEHLERADVVFSDDMVEAVGQLVDEMLRRGAEIRRLQSGGAKL